MQDPADRTLASVEAVSPVAETPTAREQSSTASTTGLARAVGGVRLEIAMVVGLTLIAAALRLWRLGTIPLGLHGDEAWTGIDARRILDEGWLGPYLISALGQPIGPAYWTAFLFSFLPDTTYVLRLSMAIFGVLTIPVSYLAFRVMFDKVVAAFAAALLAAMVWHLHLSRTAFMVQTWPFVEVCVLLVLFLAIQRRSLPLFALAGVLAGLGAYTYNSYLLFLPLPIVALVWTFARDWHDANRLGVGIIATALFLATGLIAGASMIQYADEHNFAWRYHQKVVGVTYQEEWEDASLVGKGEILADRGWEWQKGLVWGARMDLGDGLATDGHPPVEPAVYALAVLGLAMAFWRWRRAQYAVLIAAAVLLPWGAVLTVNDGLFRRTLGLAPFIAVLAALPLGWAWHRILERRPPFWPAYIAGLLLVPAYATVSAAYQYFGPVQDTFAMKYVYPYQLDAASRYIDDLPPGTYVYFYSARWPFDYETRQFLAPDAEGEDRSFQYGPPGSELDFSADTDRDVVFVFLDDYVADFERVVDDFPGGAQTEAVRDDEILYRAYFIPKAD